MFTSLRGLLRRPFIPELAGVGDPSLRALQELELQRFGRVALRSLRGGIRPLEESMSFVPVGSDDQNV